MSISKPMSISEKHKPAKSGSVRSELKLLGYVWRAAKGNHWRIVLPMIIQVIIGLFPATITYYIQSLITTTDTIGDLLSGRDIIILLGLILSLTIIKQITGLAQGYAMADVRRSIERRYVAYLSVNQDRQLSDREEHARRPGHRNMMAFTKESEMLTGLIPMVYRSFIQAPLTVISFMILMIWLSWQLSCVILLLVGAVVYCCALLRKKVKTTRRRLYSRMADLYQIFSDRIKGARVLRFYDSRGLISGKLYNVIDDSTALNKRLVKAASLQGIATELLTYLGVLAFIVIVVYGKSDNGWRILLTYPLAIMFIRSEAIKIINGYTQLAATESSVKHLTDAFDPDADTTGGLSQWPDRWKIDHIEMRDISFAYPDGNEVLHDCSAVFYTDGINVIAGESGAGKSTCLDIISMAIKPVTGKLLLAGEDSAGFTSESVARHISIVEQEPFLFEGNFYDNLTFGRDVSVSDILRLADEFNLGHILGCEADLYKDVADDGHNLSVGEKQRMSFIRAILKNPDVILLDEATSAVDGETSAAMMNYIKKYCRSILTICVSHDPAVINMADNLFYIANGTITRKPI